MKAPEEYAAEAIRDTPANYGDLPVIMAAIELVIADAITDGDRRVREAEAKGERYKNMLVTAILRSGRR